jgi:hypothetical protein
MSIAGTPRARWNCWKTKPMVLARSADSSRSLSPPTSYPSMRRVPDVGRSRVPMMLSRVDLPEPDGPTIPSSSPRSISRSADRRAGTLPYRLDTPAR